MGWLRVVTKWSYRTLGITVVLMYIAPFILSSEADPTGQAGSFAPIVALYTALLILLRSRVSRDASWGISPNTMIGLGSLFTAHLWFTDAEGTHPLDFNLPLAIVLALIPGLAITIWVFIPELVRALRKQP